MHLHLHLGKSARDRHRFVMAGVIDQNNQIDDALGHDFVIGLPKCLRCIVCRHDNNNFPAVKHRF